MNTLHTCTADGRTYLGISSLFHPALDINDPLSITTTLSDDILWRQNLNIEIRKTTTENRQGIIDYDFSTRYTLIMISS